MRKIRSRSFWTSAGAVRVSALLLICFQSGAEKLEVGLRSRAFALADPGGPDDAPPPAGG